MLEERAETIKDAELVDVARRAVETIGALVAEMMAAVEALDDLLGPLARTAA